MNAIETTAKILKNEIPVRHSVLAEINREFLEIAVEGWPDVEKISKKVLEFEGKKFTYSGWNSDRNVCYFARPIEGEVKTVKIV